MTFRTALTNLAALNVTGVNVNYDVNTVPDELNRVQLPVLLVLPGETQESRLFKERGEGFRALAFSAGARTVTYTVTHLLLIAPVETRRGLRSHLPDLIDRIDAYFTALGNDVLLGGVLLEPAQVKVEPGVFQHGLVAYHGCAFRHTWIIEV
ncbi:MAG: hypothetical protein K8I60_04490 [Anaerolineae bacterium]|nr:hypothetical protein [Anaerolineae bacterium]